MATKFGTNQLSQSPPAWWSRMETALIFVFGGAILLLPSSQIIGPIWQHELTAFILPGMILLTKGVGLFFGEQPQDNTTSIQTDSVNNKN